MDIPTESPAFEAWSTGPEIWPKQFEAALAARGFNRSGAAKPRPRKVKWAKPREIGEGKTFWPLLPWQQAFVDTLPAYIDCAGDFRHGTFKRQRDLALNFPHLQFNSPIRKVWLTSVNQARHLEQSPDTLMRPSPRASPPALQGGKSYVW